jgi:hypothetical protein
MIQLIILIMNKSRGFWKSAELVRMISKVAFAMFRLYVMVLKFYLIAGAKISLAGLNGPYSFFAYAI